MTTETDKTRYMSVGSFAAKIDWEGGVFNTLEYGLKHTDLDPDDPASAELRAAWADLEAVWRALQPALRRVEDLLEDIEAVDEDGDD